MNQQIQPLGQIQPQEQTQALMVQVMWVSTTISIIMGAALIVDVIAKVVGGIRETREIEKK